MHQVTAPRKSSKVAKADCLIQTRITPVADRLLDEASKRALVSKAQYVRILIYKSLGIEPEPIS